MRWLNAVEEDIRKYLVRGRRCETGTAGDISWSKPRLTPGCSANDDYDVMIQSQSYFTLIIVKI